MKAIQRRKQRKRTSSKGSHIAGWLLATGLLFGLCGCESETDSLEALLEESRMQQVAADAAEAYAGPGMAGETAGTVSIDTGDKVQGEAGEPTLWVHICGFVKNPGIYEMQPDSRMYDLLMAAGGFAEGADKNVLNLADYLKDGSQIYVPGVMSEDSEEQSRGSALASGGENRGYGETGENGREELVNINTASQGILETLPGIGPAKAKEILAYRREKGSFASIEEIKEVAGIKDAIYEKIKSLITVEE